MDDGPKEQAVGDLTMEPDVLVQRKKRFDDRSKDSDQVAEDCAEVSSRKRRSTGTLNYQEG